ncbi:TATA box-binding protein-associated factor RNA polymerase I subunit A [Trichoplax sp. H2]|nr:TATA box-binding protein-associated factor RNA polymerase I subunit A [Trichoplax sp. H2]|eukprot:RDD40052.1 TATA box-binding protein-associated factor RNA polymerase I subunit A [Trichoplax sp. H2]
MASASRKRSWKNANVQAGDYWKKSKRMAALEPNHPSVSSYMYFGVNTIFRQVWQEILQTNLTFDNMKSIARKHLHYLATAILHCLLAHRLTLAKDMISVLCKKFDTVPELVWKTGMEVLDDNNPYYAMRCTRFHKAVGDLLQYYFPSELVIDSVSYYVRKQRLNEAESLIISKVNVSPYMKEPLLLAQAGYFQYIQWKKQVANQNNDEVDNSDSDETRDLTHEARIAIDHLKGLVETEGVWDVHIAICAELLAYFNDKKSAKKLLKKYLQCQPTNTNAYRYLYYFRKRYYPKEVVKIRKVLAELAKFNPCDIMCLDIINYSNFKVKSSIKETLSILFDHLDYHSCALNIQPWKLLTTFLTKVDLRCDECLNLIWEERKLWWPEYHFSEDSLDKIATPSKDPAKEETNFHVIAYKAAVAIWILGSDNKYTARVYSIMKLRNLKELSCMLEKCLVLHREDN